MIITFTWNKHDIGIAVNNFWDTPYIHGTNSNADMNNNCNFVVWLGQSMAKHSWPTHFHVSFEFPRVFNKHQKLSAKVMIVCRQATDVEPIKRKNYKLTYNIIAEKNWWGINKIFDCNDPLVYTYVISSLISWDTTMIHCTFL